MVLGNVYKTEYVEKGSYCPKPEDPNTEEFHFVRWEVDGEEWKFVGYIVASDLTLDAKMELHNFSNWIYDKEPTCNEGGSKFRNCSQCWYTDTKTIDALGHSMIYESDSNGHWQVCSRCGENGIIEEHTYVNGVCTSCKQSSLDGGWYIEMPDDSEWASFKNAYDSMHSFFEMYPSLPSEVNKTYCRFIDMTNFYKKEYADKYDALFFGYTFFLSYETEEKTLSACRVISNSFSNAGWSLDDDYTFERDGENDFYTDGDDKSGTIMIVFDEDNNRVSVLSICYRNKQ